MILLRKICFEELSERGRDFNWGAHDCEKCYRPMWGHGFVGRYVSGVGSLLWMKRYRCPVCGTVATTRPAGYWPRVRSSIRQIYETIVTAKGPLKLLPGCRYSVDFALRIVADKFLNHLPYDRQRKDLKRQGVNVPVATMWRLAEQVALHAQAVAEQIRFDILQTRHLACHLDETRWPILSKTEDDGQMWILSNQAGSYYRFEPTRAGKIADELLKGFSGAVLTDKFSGYLHFRGEKQILWGLCWAHARREFMDLERAYPDIVLKVVTLIDDLFDIERKARTWEELARLRSLESAAKLEEIKSCLEETRAEFFAQDDLVKLFSIQTFDAVI